MINIVQNMKSILQLSKQIDMINLENENNINRSKQ